MRLLIVTQKVDKNDSILGFFHLWLEEFAKRFVLVTVICLQKGDQTLPNNVKVLSLGKENGRSRLKYFFNFFQYIWQERQNYDVVLVHMNPEYIVLGGWLWCILGKSINLWYVHRQVNLKLRCAILFCKNIFSVSPESFRITNKKVHFVGHGIDTTLFSCPAAAHTNHDIFQIVSVGRITEIKNLDILIEAAQKLRQKTEEKFLVRIVGVAATAADKKYITHLHNLVEQNNLKNVVEFVGPVPYLQMPSVYCHSTLAINLAPTGGLDKAILEAMSCEVSVLMSNETLRASVGDLGPILFFVYRDAENLAEKILYFIHNRQQSRVCGKMVRKMVVEEHEQARLIEKISNFLLPL